ncbi:MAG: MATE family efflux transporter [Vicinamibacterales bacterium]
MQDLTTGSLSRHLLKTTAMMLVGMTMQTLYVLVDLYWVGHLGTSAVTAAGIGGNVAFIVLAASQALGVGTTSLIAQAAGRKDHGGAIHVYGQSQLLAFVVGALFFVVSMFLRDDYVNQLAADAQTAALAHDFLTWFLPAMALQFLLVSMGSALRGTGRFGPGMWVQGGSVVLNMTLSPVFMFGWGPGEPMGIAGAALGTFVAVAAGTLAMAVYFLPKDAYLRFAAVKWKLDLSSWWAILKIGLPAGAEFAFMAIYIVVVYSVTRPFGAAAQAGFGIGMRILQSGFLPVLALGFSVGPVAGQNYGAGKIDRVRATFWDAVRMAAGAMFVFALVAHFSPTPMLRPFSSDPLVLATGAQYLRTTSWSFVASGIIFVVSSLFQALGNSVPPLIAAATRTAVMVCVLLLIAKLPQFTLAWIWWLSVSTVTMQLALNLWFLSREYRGRLALPT